MLTLKKLAIAPEASLKNAGWDWMLGENTLPYITDEVVEVSTAEAEAYHAAAEEAYELLIEAAQYVIDHDLYSQLGIPENLIEAVKISWENDKHWHLYGRFDFSGGLDNQPIKLIEFNADTATCIPETAVVQWASLKANGLDDGSQFNSVYESLVESFDTILAENPTFEATLLIATMGGYPEDDTNMSILAEAAKEAGFEVAFAYIDDVEFSAERGIFKQNPDGSFTQFDFFFKLVPWEYIGWDEPELAAILTAIVQKNLAVVMNPAYTLLFQSKGILKILWDLNPDHPLLLKTSDKPLNEPQVEKVLFGREGANVRVLDENATLTQANEGEYSGQAVVYQAYTPFMTDAAGYTYQAGVFIAAEPCGLGFRRGGKILDNKAQFCGHIVVG